MPAATNMFQQIAGTGPAPFSEFLRPHIPLDYGVQPGGLPANTGYETSTTGVGKDILAFLNSVRDRRKEMAEEDDRNTQFGLDNFQRHVTSMLADPDWTTEGKKLIQNLGDQIMNQHMHYALKDVEKEGIGGFLKNVLTQASGGPIKVRDPINWDQATGQITNALRPEHSQLYNYQDIIKRGQAAKDAMERKVIAAGRPPNKEDYDAIWNPLYQEALGKAPNYAPQILAAAGQGAPAQGSIGDLVGRYLNAGPKPKFTSPPPAAPGASGSQPNALFYNPAPIANTDILSKPPAQRPMTPGMLPLTDSPHLKAALGAEPAPDDEGMPPWWKAMMEQLPAGSGIQPNVSLFPGAMVKGANGKPVMVRSYTPPVNLANPQQ